MSENGGRMLGLAVVSSQPLLWGLPLGSVSEDEPRVRLRIVEPGELAARWAGALPRRLAERVDSSGQLTLVVDADDEHGVRVEASGFGVALIASEGIEVLGVPGREIAWHRLLFAQVLPIAAALQGLEPLHASAVEVDGVVLALVGASGAGKSTLALHMSRAGAARLSDDVLVVDAGRGGVVAHPGPGLANVDACELTRLGLAPGEVILGRDDKVQVSFSPLPRALRLDAICFLLRERVADGGVQRLTSPDPRLLLAAGFVPHLDWAQRSIDHLEACERIARSVICFRAEVNPAELSAVTADRVRKRVVGALCQERGRAPA